MKTDRCLVNIPGYYTATRDSLLYNAKRLAHTTLVTVGLTLAAPSDHTNVGMSADLAPAEQQL